jgi:thiamine transport system permease protein
MWALPTWALAKDLVVNSLPFRPYRIAGAAGVALAVAGLIVSVLVVITSAAGDAGGSSRVDIWHLVRMTSVQAGLTTVLSLIVGTAVAWSLNRLRFIGRNLVVALFASAIVTPGMVVAFGILSIWGRNGWINQTLQSLFGFTIASPAYGLSGILLAHVILDGAFAARILLARLDAVPANRLKVGQSLGLSAWTRFRLIDWPALKGSLPGLGAIIFLLAFTSFPIVLLLGGGPANQTVEVAIYSAVRLNFDLVGAVWLAVTQIGVCAVIIVLASAFAPVPAALGLSAQPRWQDSCGVRAVQWTILVIAAAGFALPLLSVLWDGLATGLPRVLQQPKFWQASATSLGIGAVSALLTLVLALIIAMGRAAVANPVWRTVLGAPAYAYLAVPAVVLSLGFFLIVRTLGLGINFAAPFVVIIANSLLALPFAMATLGPPLDGIVRNRGKLIRSLGLGGWTQFIAVEYPLLGRDIGLMLALAFCFSLGDLGVIALFGTQEFETLPLMMFRALGAYRSNDAAAIAALLLIGTIVAFIGLPRALERIAHAHRQ